MATTPWLQGLMPASAGSLLTSFASPPMSAKPMLRWWLPHGLVQLDEVKHEIDEMYAAGFGGAEIEDDHHSVKVVMDPEGHGWGTEAWSDLVLAASDHAESMGFQIDIALGPSYPASNPALTPDSEGAEKEVATGRVVVQNGTTYTGPIPPPYVAAADGVTNETLISLQAYRMNDTSTTTAVPVILEENSLLSLKCKVHNGNFTFTPPDNKTWIVIAFWMRGTAQQPESGPHTDPLSYVIDHFSVAGMESSTNFWDDHILTPKIRTLMKKIGGSIFEDSIELDYSTLWTPNLREEFKKRTGYDLYRYLPAVAQENQKNAFKFSDDLTRGVINDFWDVMGDLYVDYHVGTLKPWAHNLGMKVRAQVYGLPTAAMSASGAIDIPEGETLGFKNLGDYRSIAGPANMKGQKLMSNEACAFAGAAYTVTWDLVLQTLNPVFSTGNNHQVFHGFSYIEAPDADWPGFASFTPYGSTNAIGYSESWGPRTPLWKHAPDVTGYIARMQYILQSGKAQHDVVFFEQKGYIGAGYNSPWWSDSGVELGWSLNIIGPDMLDYDSAFVRDGRFVPDGPAYKVLSFEQDTFASAVPAMPLDSATKLLKLAKGGLPMLIVGNWSSPDFYGWAEQDKTNKLKSIFDELLALPHVVNVATRDDIPTGVPLLPVGPDVQLSNNSQIINYHRVDGDIDYFLLVAASPATFAVSTKTKVYDADADVILPRRSADVVPVLLNLWTGEATPLAEYEELSDSQIKFHVYIKAYSTMMIALMPLKKKPVHAVSSDAVSLRRDESGLYLRVNTTGSFTTTLNTGKEVKTSIKNMPAAQELKGWKLSVQDWQPTSNISTPYTIYKTHELDDLETLESWTSYDELEDVSGIGNYTTTFTLKDWPSAAGAILDIPTFVGSLRLTVNGQKLPPPDHLNSEHDIGPWLKGGKNTLEIEVATTLLNRLRLVTPVTYGGVARQNYGLVSPIMLKPYTEKKISD